MLFLVSQCMFSYFFFFFSSRRRHTRLQGDWSSDVCSSDLMIRHTRLQGDWSSDVCSSDQANRPGGCRARHRGGFQHSKPASSWPPLRPLHTSWEESRMLTVPLVVLRRAGRAARAKFGTEGAA